MTVRGVGVDTVDLGAFAAALREPGTRFASAFTATERRQCRDRCAARGAESDPDAMTRHLAARWAAKEAVIKAWSAALYGSPPVISPEAVRWSEIETVCDLWGRPSIRLSGQIEHEVRAALGESVSWQVSLSHDGGSAIAFVVLEA